MHDILANYIKSQSRSETRISVWSLVVTIFGDAIAPRGGVLRLGALQKITDHIGISNNALRTAMSRLASDGWLERQRIGRASFYKPSSMAALENEAASKIIYQFSPAGWNGDWLFALSSEPEGFSSSLRAKLHTANFAFQNRKLAIAPDVGDGRQSLINLETADMCVFTAQSIGGENDRLVPDRLGFHHDCIDQYQQFTSSSVQLASALNNTDEIFGLDALLLRLLLLHQWRRIVLKDVHWPIQLRPQNWPGFPAQKLVRELYHELLIPSEIWLSQLDATPDGLLPPAKKSLMDRFE